LSLGRGGRLEIQDTIVTEVFRDQASADQAFRQECATWKQNAQQMAGALAVELDCGTPRRARHPGIRLVSDAKLTLSSAGDLTLNEAEYVIGNGKTESQAYDEFRKNCGAWKTSLKTMPKGFIFASCGKVTLGHWKPYSLYSVVGHPSLVFENY
jgi:hypothetical protein